MELSVELMVFLGIGVILLGLFTTFIYQWNMKEDVDTLQRVYTGEGAAEAMKIDKVELMEKAREFWDFCNHSSANETRLYYVYNTNRLSSGSLNKSDLFDYYRSLSGGQSIQSLNQSCGKREDVNISTITLPSIIKLMCMNATLHIYPPNETR
jgi:hypothetical protein